MDFVRRQGWELAIYQMLAVDYLVANRDRHGSNVEVLRDQQTGRSRLAPLFDQGVSLLFSTYGNQQQIQACDVMQDFQGNNFIGSRSLAYNLSLIPQDVDLKFRCLMEEHRGFLLHGLDDILTREHLDKIWEMIWRRWNFLEGLRSKK